MQKEFKPQVEEATVFCKNYFAKKLLAMYKCDSGIMLEMQN